MSDYSFLNEKVENMTNEKLVEIIEKMLDYDLVEDALVELFYRKVQVAKNLSYQILEKEKGDVYLRACVIGFLYNHDKNNFLGYIEYNVDNLNYELGQLMSDLAGDMLQNNNKNMEKSFLDKILIQYDSLGKETKNKIKNDYEWFLGEYKKRY